MRKNSVIKEILIFVILFCCLGLAAGAPAIVKKITHNIAVYEAEKEQRIKEEQEKEKREKEIANSKSKERAILNVDSKKNEKYNKKQGYYNFPSQLFFISNVDWTDKGDYYEISEPCEVQCYDYIDLEELKKTQVGGEVESGCGNKYTVIEDSNNYNSIQDYVGEIKSDTFGECQVYDLKNGYGRIQSDQRGKTIISSIDNDKVKIKIKKNAIVSGSLPSGENFSESSKNYYTDGNKKKFDDNEKNVGLIVVYYPVFDKDGYVSEMKVDSKSSSLGY